jgi:hypothetical protein
MTESDRPENAHEESPQRALDEIVAATNAEVLRGVRSIRDHIVLDEIVEVPLTTYESLASRVRQDRIIPTPLQAAPLRARFRDDDDDWLDDEDEDEREDDGAPPPEIRKGPLEVHLYVKDKEEGHAFLQKHTIPQHAHIIEISLNGRQTRFQWKHDRWNHAESPLRYYQI